MISSREGIPSYQYLGTGPSWIYRSNESGHSSFGLPADSLEVLILQYVALLRDGQQVKMSKRAGEFITMQDLVDEVGERCSTFLLPN